MLYISLEDIQELVPEVYAWRWTYHPELGVYRAIAWMNIPYEDSDKVRFDKYLLTTLAGTKEGMLDLVYKGITAALAADKQKNLRRP